jgi:hypothetical protein
MHTSLESSAAELGAGPSSRNALALRVRVFDSLENLPPCCLRLFDEAGRQDFFLTHSWFRNFAATALNEGFRPRVYAVVGKDESEAAEAMFVGRVSPGTRSLSALTNYYSSYFNLHLRDPHAENSAAIKTLVESLRTETPRWDTIDVQPLDPGPETFTTLVDAFRGTGFVVQTFFRFGNWYLPVNGRSYAEYLPSLPSALRNTLSRKMKRFEKSGRGKIQIVTGGPELDSAIEDYTQVHLASWKQAEPYPKFIPGMIRMAAAMGTLRLGLIHVDGAPAAAQLWIVYRGSALLVKLGYCEKFADLSVGTILTSLMMQHVLDVDRVELIDYLSGDDPYKREWMSHRRERWGILAMNPRTPRGAAAILRNHGGRTVKRAISAMRARLRGQDKDRPTQAGA